MQDHDSYAALRLTNYRLFFLGNFASNFGMHVQAVAVQWDIYQRTGQPMALGLTGLVQFLPVVSLFLVAGHVTDRYSRKAVLVLAHLVIALSSLGLAVIHWTQADYRWIYVCLAAVGVARAFLQPAKSALLPLLVPTSLFGNAVAWNTTGFQLASVFGPAAGSVLLDYSSSLVWAYLLDAAAAIMFVGCILLTQPRPMTHARRGVTFDELVAGFRFLAGNQVVLGALLLDLFAVLLGGAVALMPIYADDILHTARGGIGWLRLAPAVGALIVAFLMAHRPPLTRAGTALLASVAGFGLATIGFGLSTSLGLSLVMLALIGAFDNISVVIRQTLVQTQTPDALRGRVSAVNSLFIGASNELGAFESGAVAQAFGPVFSVVSGGIGTILVVLITAVTLPKLRKYGQLGTTTES